MLSAKKGEGFLGGLIPPEKQRVALTLDRGFVRRMRIALAVANQQRKPGRRVVTLSELLSFLVERELGWDRVKNLLDKL